MNNKDYLSVLDTSATFDCPQRQHQIMFNGEVMNVDFEQGKPTILAREIGLKFMMPGFIVRDLDDNELIIPSTNTGELAEDEVVAKLAELTDDALLIRSISKIGGEQFAVGEVSRAALISFLTSKPADAEDDEQEFGVDLLTDEDDLDNADVSDNVGSGLTAPTGLVPENAEDEITLDVGDEVVSGGERGEVLEVVEQEQGLSEEAKAAHAEQAVLEAAAAEQPAVTDEIKEIVAEDNAKATENVTEAEAPAGEIVANDEAEKKAE